MAVEPRERPKVALEVRPVARYNCGMRLTLLRFVLLRVLPARLIPILTVLEILRLVRRFRSGR